MANQSAIDFMTCFMCIFYHLTKNIKLTADHSELANNLHCWFWQSEYFYYSLSTSSVYNLVFMTIERYFAITNPLKYNHDKVYRRLPIVLTLAWFSGFILGVDVTLFMEVIDYDCTFTTHIRFPALFKIMLYYYIISHIAFPALVMSAAYIKMGLTLKNTGFTSKTNTKAQTNLFQTCLLLMVTFLVVGIYHFIMMVLQMRNIDPDTVDIQYHVSSTLFLLNSTINPFIYCIRYKKFQVRAKQLFSSALGRPIEETLSAPKTSVTSISNQI